MPETKINKQCGEAVPILKPDERLKIKLETLAAHFKSQFHCEPTFFVRVPGRVNLIGEHIDYCGYSVCPMAIEQSVLVAVSKTTDVVGLRLINLDSQYSDYELQDMSTIKNMELDDHRLGPSWHKYFLCGIKGALEVVPEELVPKGLLIAVWGNVPPNAGLSSSSALVSAALLATIHVSQFKMSKEEMATISANAERYIGTQGGGMDQAIAFLGKGGSAKLIEFNPLRSQDVTLPERAVFVIAHSLADHNKTATSYFNTRVLECRLAAKVIAKKRGVLWETVKILSDVQKILNKSLQEMAEVVLTDLHEEPYTCDEVCEVLETTRESLSLTSNILADTSVKLRLRERALHVFQEAERVAEFCRTCGRKDLSDESERLFLLGSLMSASHTSLRDLYECSHPRVDALVDAANSCGALGARLTGAGWGGCIIALTTVDKAEDFVRELKEKFYQNDERSKNLDLSNFIFQTEPKQGASIYQVD